MIIIILVWVSIIVVINIVHIVHIHLVHKHSVIIHIECVGVVHDSAVWFKLWLVWLKAQGFVEKTVILFFQSTHFYFEFLMKHSSIKD